MSGDITDTHDIASRNIIPSLYIEQRKGLIDLRDIPARRILASVSKGAVSAATIGAVLKAYREANKVDGKLMTQQALATKLGISQGQISDWERGIFAGTYVSTLLKIAARMGVLVETLVKGMDEEYDAATSDLVSHTPAVQVPLPSRGEGGERGSTPTGLQLDPESVRSVFEQLRQEVVARVSTAEDLIVGRKTQTAEGKKANRRKDDRGRRRRSA